MARGESPRDVALVLSRMVHAIGIRTGPHELVEELAEHASVPVINMLTQEHHPCQALADLMTLRERFGEARGAQARLRRRRQQHGALAADRRAARRRGGRGGLAAGAVAAGGAGRRARGGGARGARPLHRRLGEHGRRGRRGAPPRAARAVPDRRRAACAGARRRDRAALPARPSGRGDHRGRALRRALRGLGPGGEPPARPEGAARASTVRAHDQAPRADPRLPRPRSRRLRRG